MIDRGGEGARKINGATMQVGEESRKENEKNNHTLVWGIKPEITLVEKVRTGKKTNHKDTKLSSTQPLEIGMGNSGDITFWEKTC